jgi:hypothetical protein
VEFNRELRDDVLARDITLSVRLWKRPQVRQGGRYRVGPGLIEVDAIEIVPFAAITEADVRRAGEPDRVAAASAKFTVDGASRRSTSRRRQSARTARRSSSAVGARNASSSSPATNVLESRCDAR